jgi:magnesium-transporting ATPase (P-type)
MITGDKKETAVTVAHQVGLLNERDMDKINYHEDIEHVTPIQDDWSNVVLTSNDLRMMNDQQIAAIMPRLRVVARALPTDKSRLVKIAQNMHHVVGMTGDGVNDSAALKKADVGFAMGSGADMAKEASDIVILDDNFSSIAQSVLYGRTIFRSIRKFIVFQSTVNLASTVIVFIGPFLGFDFPLSLVQLLWVNLVMDTLAALAYGGEPALAGYMDHRPIQREAPIISLEMWTSIISSGLFIAFVSVFWLTYDGITLMFQRDGVADRAALLTGFFCYFIFATNFNSFNVRTKGTNLTANLFENRNFLIVISLIFIIQITFTIVGGSVLKTVPLTFNEWMTVTGLALLIIPWDLFRKTVILPRVRQYFRTRKGKFSQIKDNFV